MKIQRIGVGGGQPSPEAGTARVEQISKTGEALQVAGKTIQGVSETLYKQINDARNASETMTAKRKAIEGLSAIAAQEANALNSKGERKTGSAEDLRIPQEEIGKLREDVLGGFSDKTARDAFSQDYDLLATHTGIEIRKGYMKNVINNGQAETQKSSDQAVEFFGTSDGKGDIEKQLDSIWGDAVRDGFYDADVANEKKKKALKQARNNLFISDAKKNREQAKKNLSNNVYKFDPKEMDTALSTLVHYKELEDKNELSNKIDSRYEIIDSIATGKEDLYNLSPIAQELVDNDDVLAEAISLATKNTKGYYAKDADEEIVKVFKEASEATDRDALSALALSAIYRTKNISPDKLGALLFYAAKRSQTLTLSEKIISPMGDETTAGEVLQNQIDAGLNGIRRWVVSGNTDAKTHGQVYANYMNEIKNGETPYNALGKVLRETNIALHPEMVTYPKEGQLITDKQGNLQMAFPTGDIKPIEGRKSSSAPKSEGEKNKSKSKKSTPKESGKKEYAFEELSK